VKTRNGWTLSTSSICPVTDRRHKFDFPTITNFPASATATRNRRVSDRGHSQSCTIGIVYEFAGVEGEHRIAAAGGDVDAVAKWGRRNPHRITRCRNA
jgi:hypothetical protein